MAVKVLNKLEQIGEDLIPDGFIQCIECGLIEEENHVAKGKHICGRITDVNHKIHQELVLKIGKRRIVKLTIK